MSVLAGDLAAAWALASMLELSVPAGHLAHAVRELAHIEEEVVQGQLLDVCAAPGNASDVEVGYSLKTASYTARGPVVIGARLAGAGEGPSGVPRPVRRAARRRISTSRRPPRRLRRRGRDGKAVRG